MTKYPIKKYSAPTNLVSEPKGTMWVVEEGEQESLYVQLSGDPKLPHWARFGTILEDVFRPYSSDENFMGELFKLYEKESKDMNGLLKSMKKSE